MREDRSVSWDQLQQSILSKLYYLMLNGSQAQVTPVHLTHTPLRWWSGCPQQSMHMTIQKKMSESGATKEILVSSSLLVGWGRWSYDVIGPVKMIVCWTHAGESVSSPNVGR